MTSPFAQQAEKLYKAGYSILPLLKGDKKAYLEDWSKYCTTRMPVSKVKGYIKEDGLNIGVALGPASNIVALDFDDDINGLHEKIKALVPESSVIKVGQKGFTAFYRYNGEKNRSWKTKVDGKKYTVVELLSEGRQTVVPPSMHPEGKEYVYTTLEGLEDVKAEDLPELPKDFNRMVDKIMGIVDEEDSRGMELSIAEVEDALSFIDPDDYEDWVRCGMAIKTVHPDQDGFFVWDQWAAQSSKYDSKESKDKWASFRRTGVSMGTLVYLAMQNGWDCKAATDELRRDTMKSFITLDQIEDELDSWHTTGRDMGTACGVAGVDDFLHFRKGEVTVVSGYGNAGKSEFLDSVLVGLMNSQDDWKFAICSMEKGQRKHYDDLVQKVTRKPRNDTSTAEYKEAKAFLRTHVLMTDYVSIKRDFDELLVQLRRYMRLGQLDGLVIDPFNLLVTRHKHLNMLSHTSHVITECANIAKELDIHVFIVAHPTKPDTTFGKLPKMTKYSIAGGADWVNVADNIIIVNRGESNTTEIGVEKVRDQEVDRLGSFKLTYDKYSRDYTSFFGTTVDEEY